MLVRRFAAAVALTTALAFTVPLSADAASVTHSSVRISTGDVDFETSRTKLSSDSRVFSRVLSDRYHRHVDADDVFALRANFDLGFGDISLAYGIAERSGRSVYEVARHRRTMGWGQIAHLYGVHVQDLKRSSDDIIVISRNRGIDITYIDLDGDGHRRYHRDNKRWERDHQRWERDHRDKRDRHDHRNDKRDHDRDRDQDRRHR